MVAVRVKLILIIKKNENTQKDWELQTQKEVRNQEIKSPFPTGHRYKEGILQVCSFILIIFPAIFFKDFCL